MAFQIWARGGRSAAAIIAGLGARLGRVPGPRTWARGGRSAAIFAGLRALLGRVPGPRSFTKVDEPSTADVEVPRVDLARALRDLMPRWVPTPAMTVESALLALAVITGALLRFVNLGGVGLNSDEAVYASQAASLSGNPNFTGLFPVVRAHPVLFQVLMSPFYRSGTPDVPGRYINAMFGMGTIGLVFVLGMVLYSRRVGAIAALLLAVMPYHVVISRQILLDGPMTFFGTASLVCLAVFGRTERRNWLVLAGACLGLAALSKETAIILIGSVFVFLSLVSRLWRPVRYILAAAGAAVGLAMTYPFVTAVSGGSRSGQSYLIWQLTRQPNHSFSFYLTTVPKAMGLLVLGAAALSLVLYRRERTWREVLLLSWVAVPFLFFEIWPVKGFSYLLVTTPAIVVLASRTIDWIADREFEMSRTRALALGAGALCVMSLLVPSVRTLVSPSTTALAGGGGTVGGREAGKWIASHVPQGAEFMTIGPSMANLIQYYSGHRSDGLSVSPNPLHRNPSYFPILNADSALRSGTYQYIVWDAYSAQRSPTFAARAITLMHRFHGRPVHVERGTLRGKRNQPLIIIYQVIP